MFAFKSLDLRILFATKHPIDLILFRGLNNHRILQIIVIDLILEVFVKSHVKTGLGDCAPEVGVQINVKECLG